MNDIYFTSKVILQVHLQTQQTKVKVTTLIGRLYKSDGVLGFYNGLSASVTRQVQYENKMIWYGCLQDNYPSMFK